MALQLYYGSGSPFAWRVWLALEHKHVAYELKTLSFSAEDTKKPEFLALNPRGQVPVLVDDGFVLYESAAIIEYLEESFPKAPLFPRDLHKRALCRRMIREIDQYLNHANELLVQQLFFTKPEAWDHALIADARTRYLAELAHWESQLTHDCFLGELSAVDLSLLPVLAMAPRFELRKPDLGLVAARGPKLSAWFQRMQALPYYDKTIPPHWRS